MKIIMKTTFNKILNISLVLIALIIFGGKAWGASASITFADEGLENGVQYTDPFEIGESTGVTITFDGGGNDGKYYDTGTGMRTYGGGTVTVDAGSGTLTNIVFTFSGASYAAPDGVSDVGTYTLSTATGTWTGSASSVTLTRASGSGHWRLQSVSVTYTPASTGYTVDFAVNTVGYGTVSPSAQLTNIASGTAITKGTGANVNQVTVNGTTVTATPHAQDADYNYTFSSWSVTDNLTTVTKNITITANFTRTERALTNYRTKCCTPLASINGSFFRCHFLGRNLEFSSYHYVKGRFAHF